MAKKNKDKNKEKKGKRKKKYEGRVEVGRGHVAVPGYMASANAFLNNIGFVLIINTFVCWDSSQWLLSPGTLLKAYILTTFAKRRPPLSRINIFTRI